MSRKRTRARKGKPLTAKNLADMDANHELKKSEAIKKRGITAAVTDRTDAPAAAAEQPTVTETEMMDTADAAHSMGRIEGIFEGATKMRQAMNACPIAQILREVHKEVHKAQGKHRPMAGPHEAFAVIKEELDEYWDEVKADRATQASGRLELIQTAAMAVRAIFDTLPR